jgi:diaminopimelate decarboxylase
VIVLWAAAGNDEAAGEATDMGNLMFHGCDATELARDFGTPLYVMSEDEITRRIRFIKSCFDEKYERCATHYASKAFLTRDMLRILAREGIGLDVVSGGELFLARAENFPPEKIAFHGNSKTEREIADALDYRVGKFVCDSAEEIEVVGGMARSRGVAADILIRVNPGVTGHTHGHMLTSGVRTKFGLPPEAIPDAVSLCARLNSVSLLGFHFHVGSQFMNNEPHIAALEVMLDLIKRTREETGYLAGTLDMGGGFGVAYTGREDAAPVDAFIRPMVERVEKFCAEGAIPRPSLVIEPGRCIAGPSGITLYTVCSVKEIPGVTTYVGVDGGYSDNPRPALYGAEYDAAVADRPDAPRSRRTTLVGKCCETGDVIINDIALPPVRRGDIIAVFCTGAYNHSMASNYNKNPIPAVVMIKDGAPRMSVRRQSYEEIFACDG